MAKINGIEIKALKTFIGHDGPGYLQGNVYYKGKKLGFWSQDAWCGPDLFEFDTEIIKEAATDFQSGFSDDNQYKKIMDQPEMLIFAVIELQRKEKFVKSTLRKGYSVLFISDPVTQISFPVPANMSDEEILTTYKKDICQMKEKCRYKNPRIEIIHSLDYFNLIVDKNHPAPDYLQCSY